VRLVVSDSTGRRSTAALVTVSASPCGGNAPTVTVAASPTSLGVGTPVRFVPTVADADNDTACQALAPPPWMQSFSYAWTLLAAPSGSAATLSGTTAREPSLVPDRAGTYSVRLVVTDSTGRASAPVDTTVTAGTCGTNGPTASASAAPTAPGISQPVTFSVALDDADNASACQAVLGALQPLRWAWRLTRAPAGSAAALLHPESLNPSLVPDLAGEYAAEVLVEDGTGRMARGSASFTASACGGAAPTVAPTASSLPRVGAVVALAANAADADSAAPCSQTAGLTFWWWLAEAPAGSRASLGVASARDASFIPDVAGTYVAGVLATDSTGRGSAPGFVTVTVSPCGGAVPVARITAPATVSAGVTTIVALDALGAANPSSDADNAAPCSLGQTLSFHWELFAAPAGASATLTPTATSSNPWFRAERAGTYVVRLRVLDSSGLASPLATATITAN